MIKFKFSKTAFILIGFCLTGCASDGHAKPPVVNMNGDWHQSDSDSTQMSAKIFDGHIEITMHSGIVNGLYWGGSFDTKNASGRSFDITSTADETGLSQNTTKIFTYKDGQLSYEFTMLGKTRLIHLTR